MSTYRADPQAFSQKEAIFPAQAPSIGIRTSEPMPMEDVLYYTALLAGLGTASRAIASQLTPSLSSVKKETRTCIDSGSEMMFSLCAPASRCLRVLTRQDTGHEGSLFWRRSYYQPDTDLERWHTETYRNEQPAAWKRASEMAKSIDQMENLQRIHAILGPHSHIYSINWQISSDTPQVWVGWQLDRTFTPDQALQRLSCVTGWTQAVREWELLLGVAPRPHLGPWSISVLLNDVSHLRLGSTNWARCLEDRSKRRRLVALMEAWGGDQRFAEALYKLIETATRPGRPHAIGRAVEMEFMNGFAKEIEFFICIP